MKSFVSGLLFLATALPAAAGDLKFRVQEFENTLKVGYAVCIADVNNDKKPDIVVVDAKRVLWYENPTWKPRIIIEDQTPPDNVCIAPCDIDRDGNIDFFLGADWGRMDTTKGGTIHWLRHKKSLDEKWDVFKIGEEPTVHRMQVQRRTLIVAPLMGRDATKAKNWLDGRPVRILTFPIPSDPVKGPWTAKAYCEDDAAIHVVHNFHAWSDRRHGLGMTIASYEGITRFNPPDYGERTIKVSPGNQEKPNSNRGASEIAVAGSILAAVEPWHGHQVVVYTANDGGDELFHRHVIDDKLRWGHAIKLVDLDGDKQFEIIAGVRDDLSKNPGERRGVRIYTCTDGKGEKWSRQLLDEGGVAVEDLIVHDLDGDGRPDIIAVGRQTGNGRIYWNLGR